MEEEEIEKALNNSAESNIPEDIISAAKLKRLRNLKYFRDYTDDQIIAWVKNKKKNEAPPANPADIVSDAPAEVQEAVDISLEEYKKKFDAYLKKYRKEFGVDINDANDAESLRALVRYIIQQEIIDTAILKESNKPSPHPGTLKALGDFQRTVQQNVNEIQDKLGISRKQRKEKQVDDIPQYITALQKKAAAFWERSTTAVRCQKCRIELARYWINFPDTTRKITFELECDKCHEKVIYSV